MLSRALAEVRRVVRDDGVVTIVFGHGDPEVWHRLLAAITAGGLYLTGSWPAKTEAGGKAGSANIVTTLTLSCRPAPKSRPTGRVDEVDDEVRREVRLRVGDWERAHLALPDQLMASAGPAMEAVGRYSAVLDQLGEPVDAARYLVLARRAVEEAAAIRIDDVPLETFDARTRFALFWVRLYGRGLAPKSEARWQALSSDLELADVNDVIREGDGGRGVRLAYGREARAAVDETSPVVDVALAMARAGPLALRGSPTCSRRAAETGTTPTCGRRSASCARLPEADVDVQAWERYRQGARERGPGIGRGNPGAAGGRRQAEAVRRAARPVRRAVGRRGSMTRGVTPWWDAMRLRREIADGLRIIEDVQMSLFGASTAPSATARPTDTAYYGEITHPSPNLVEFVAKVAVRLGGGARYTAAPAFRRLDQADGRRQVARDDRLWHLAEHPAAILGDEIGRKAWETAGQNHRRPGSRSTSTTRRSWSSLATT